MGGVVVIALENIPEGGHRHVVRVAHVVRGGSEAGAIGINAHRDSTGVEMTVRGLFANALRVAVVAARDEMTSVLGFDIGPAVAKGEVPLTTGSSNHGVKRVIVATALKAGEEDFASVDLGIEDGVPINVGVNDDGRGGGEDDLVIENRDPERGVAEAFLRDEDVGGIGFAIVVGVFDHHDGLAGLDAATGAVVDPFGDPKTAQSIGVHRDRGVDQRRLSPDLNLKIRVCQLEDLNRNSLNRAVFLCKGFAVRR